MRLLGLLVLALALVACGDDFATIEPENPTKAADGLVFTRADGSSYEIKDAVASCYAAEQKPALEVLRLSAPADLVRGARDQASFVVEVAPGTTGTFQLPLEERAREAGPSDVTVTAFDTRRRNELTGSSPRSSGQITIRESTCDPEPRLSVTVDATLGSQGGLPPVEVEGGMASAGR